MNNLVEFMTLTKGIEYLLAIAFVFGFLGFWQWQHHRGRGLLLRIAPALLLALGFAGLASTCISSSAIATSRVEERVGAGAEDIRGLVNVHGPAKAAAHAMGPDVISCQTCHHRSPDGQPGPCSSCHNGSNDGQVVGTIGLKAAYHQRCMECHQGACLGPSTCTNCHAEGTQSAKVEKDPPAPVVAPAISHPLPSGYGDCLACHNPGGLLPLPGNHAGYDAASVCLRCHKFSAVRGTVSLALEVPSRASASGVAPAPAGSKPAAAAAMPHQVAGRENCLSCHGQGTADVRRLSPGHAGRTNGSCLQCHQPS